MRNVSNVKKLDKKIRKINSRNKIYDKVVIDTAAGIHLVHNKDWLLDYAPLIKAPEYWGVGDDKNPIEILGEGILPIKGGRNNVIGVTAYYSPKQDATILSADKLYQETGITLDKGYKSLVSEEKDFDTKTLKLGNTVWVDTCEIIDVKTHDKKIRAVRPINPLTIKPNITLLEAHLRLNHFPATGIIKSIEMNNFDDVKMIKGENKGRNINKPRNRDLKQKHLDNHLQETNIDNIPKINTAGAYNTVQDLYPKKNFKKKKVICHIALAERWEESSSESWGEILPQRKTIALFYI